MIEINIEFYIVFKFRVKLTEKMQSQKTVQRYNLIRRERKIFSLFKLTNRNFIGF